MRRKGGEGWTREEGGRLGQGGRPAPVALLGSRKGSACSPPPQAALFVQIPVGPMVAGSQFSSPNCSGPPPLLAFLSFFL